MSYCPDVLWLEFSPSLKKLHQPLLRELSQKVPIGLWEYSQTPDEPLSLDVGLTLLHDYLKSSDRPIHLVGHSISGGLGWLYALRHPERVKSLTFLSVGTYPLVNWHSHYYARLELLPCSRETILRQMAYSLFGRKANVDRLVLILEQDLMSSLSPHTLCRSINLSVSPASVPLFVCGSDDDPIIDSQQLEKWESWLKQGDRIWKCSTGRHFFHYFHPQPVADRILSFWNSLDRHTNPSLIPMSAHPSLIRFRD